MPQPNRLTRREALAQLGGVTAASLLFSRRFCSANEPEARSGMGLVIYCCRFEREALKKTRPQSDLYDPLTFLEHCHAVGAGGMQARLGIIDHAPLRILRDRAEETGLFIEAIISPPQGNADLDRFTAEMKTAREAGVLAARTTIIPGRRYERFKSLSEFKEFAERGHAALLRAVPVAEKLKLPIAVENHKDHRNDERVRLFESISSEYVGACLDTGNSIALLEDPLETARVLAPWTHSVHLKDQALAPAEDGFLLGDIPLGQGSLDLEPIVDLIRKNRPHVRFSLELITRDPLPVPVLTERYWQPFPDLPARDLARTMRMVHSRKSDHLQQVSSLPFDQQVELERANVMSSLKYARDVLKL